MGRFDFAQRDTKQLFRKILENFWKNRPHLLEKSSASFGELVRIF